MMVDGGGDNQAHGRALEDGCCPFMFAPGATFEIPKDNNARLSLVWFEVLIKLDD
jgi:hypothetical protein